MFRIFGAISCLHYSLDQHIPIGPAHRRRRGSRRNSSTRRRVVLLLPEPVSIPGRHSGNYSAAVSVIVKS